MLILDVCEVACVCARHPAWQTMTHSQQVCAHYVPAKAEHPEWLEMAHSALSGKCTCRALRTARNGTLSMYVYAQCVHMLSALEVASVCTYLL
jgi:hypothetical protein